MRVIAGTLRGRKLQAPDAGDLRVRPTSDRAREALFSILGRWPAGPFLDLFGGTGAVALEAWSRGYAPVACLEKAPHALDLIAANVRGTGIRVLSMDARRFRPEGDWAVVFADPPYDLSGSLWGELAPRLVTCLARGGVLVWETDADTELAPVPGWTLADSRRYGAARFHFLKAQP